MLRHILPCFFITFLIIVLNGCSDSPSPTPYKHEGFSVIPAEGWEFSKDTNVSLFGEREVIFSLGEFSFAAFYVQDKPSNFSDFIDFYLQKTLPSISQPNAEVDRLEKKIADYNAIITTVRTLYFSEEEITILYAVNIPTEKKNIYFMSLIAPEDEVAINDKFEAVIESLQLEF